MDRWRLSGDLRVERDAQGSVRVVDPPLGRAVRLGAHDGRLALALRAGGSVHQLAGQSGLDPVETEARLHGLSRLYLIADERRSARRALQSERTAFAEQCRQPAAAEPIEWPAGRDPPRHRCVGTGTCCGATFLGPLTAADRLRVAALPGASPPDALFEEVTVGDAVYSGMARTGQGACVAQGPDGLCDIHRAHGSDAKPVACRLFPLRLHRTPAGVHVSLLLACDGYDRARDAATGAWSDREGEVRALIAQGAEPLRASLPLEWTAGLPVAQAEWRSLRQAFLDAEPQGADGRGWLLACLGLASDAIDARCRALRVASAPANGRLAQLARAVQQREALGSPAAIAAWVAQLRARAASLPAGRDAVRLQRLAEAMEAQATGVGLHVAAGGPAVEADAAALRHLHDIVANDLPAHVALGHLDAGLELMVRRLLLAEALACALARQEGRSRVSARDTTAALHVVYRSEADLQAMGRTSELLPSADVPAG